MPGTFPRFILYQSNGTTPVYEFECVLDYGDGIYQDPITFAKHESLRGQGSIISEGSTTEWELPLEFYLKGNDYADLIAEQSTIQTTILKNTKYVLKVDLTPSTTKALKVKRLSSIRFPITNPRSKVVTSQRGFITFVVDCWA